jgi:hypothetical protein
MRWAGHAARMGQERKVYKVEKPEGKRPLGKPRRRWENVIRMDLREIGLDGVDWIRLAQERDLWRAVVSAVMNLRFLAPQSYLVSRYKECVEFYLHFQASQIYFSQESMWSPIIRSLSPRCAHYRRRRKRLAETESIKWTICLLFGSTSAPQYCPLFVSSSPIGCALPRSLYCNRCLDDSY